MFHFLQYKSIKRYIAMDASEPITAFVDKADGEVYVRNHPVCTLKEVNCAILPPCGYEDESEHDLAVIYILLKIKNTPTPMELWCCDGMEEGLLYAYAHHLANGGKKENFAANLARVDFFKLNNTPNEKISSNSFLTDILSHANENNYPLVLSLLEFCLTWKLTSAQGLIQAEENTFTYPDKLVKKEEERMAIVERQTHSPLPYELFTDYGFQADAYYKKMYQQSNSLEQRKRALILLHVIRGYTLCFPTLAYQMIIEEEKLPHPKKV